MQQYNPQQWPAQQPVPYQQQPKTDGLAVASLVLGIVWVFWVGSVLAVIFGHVALRRIDRGETSGKGMAVAGLVLGYLGVAGVALVIVLAIIGAAAGGGSSSGASNAPQQSQQVQQSNPVQQGNQVQQGKPSYPDALRQYDRSVFKPYTDSELKALLSSICSAQASGVGNHEITRDLVSSGFSIDAAAPMIFIAPDYC